MGRPFYRAGPAARRRAGRVAGGRGHRDRRVVELEHHRAQFHSPALFPRALSEPAVLGVLEHAARHPASAVARPSSRAPRRHRMAAARLSPSGFRNAFSAGLLDRPGGAATPRFLDGVSSRLSRWPRSLRTARALRACARGHQPLRMDLQRPALQRWLPRRAPRQSGNPLDAVTGAYRERRPHQPLARACAMARCAWPEHPVRRPDPRRARKAGAAVSMVAMVRAPQPPSGFFRARATVTAGPSRGHRRGRSVSKDRAHPA